jgi:hypothetical protein
MATVEADDRAVKRCGPTSWRLVGRAGLLRDCSGRSGSTAAPKASGSIPTHPRRP